VLELDPHGADPLRGRVMLQSHAIPVWVVMDNPFHLLQKALPSPEFPRVSGGIDEITPSFVDLGHCFFRQLFILWGYWFL
jgi:hypothetical protein